MSLSIKKGDTFSRKVLLIDNEKNIIKKDDIKTLYITVREQALKNYPIIFQKKIEDVTIDEEGYCHFEFSSIDTEKLEYGKYYFDISLTLKNDFRKTELYELEVTQKTTFYKDGGEVVEG